ncbi:MAG: bifunctional 4-hydroxy-2-oxoglutarate aldolase/2-dehydro-3-deoxy-phosphogluconate aldolase [Spirochaetaceae bacterium]|nr:bifunctional 4-hydroxy-2-oxoglutarate aldolase/2-dehydro-3-deoxy-phosphogluconate aldolase [Spirochaetaceae bacterium]
MSDAMDKLGAAGLLPVIKIDNVADAVPLSKALLAGNLPVAEITFRTDAAEGAIAAIHKELPEMILGAGTVLTTEQADRAIGAGASYIVSPGLNPKVVEHCLKKGVPVTPGVTSPTEVELAMSLGLKLIKFFPAEQSGGLDMLKTFATVYGNVKFIPTGGISAKNLAAYAKATNVHAVGGSWMVTPELINGKKWDKITELATEAVAVLHGFHVGHVGINHTDEVAANSTMDILGKLFGLKKVDGNSAMFAANALGNQFELMKKMFLGKNGHIAIMCNNVDRACALLAKQGITFNEETRKGDAFGTKVVYLNEEIAGFALHLSRV